MASYVEQRFTDDFRIAYGAWIAENEPTTGPFEMKGVHPPGNN